MKVTGKMSTFGGPKDEGVSPTEGLSLISPGDLIEWWFKRIFLSAQPINTSGLARRLNPDAFYIALRWTDSKHGPAVVPQGIDAETARRAMFKCSANGRVVWAQGADYGPAQRTGRVADVSPGVAKALHLNTNDEITIEMFT
jgi:hypothetical protein